ncbi:MAG: hypothetical protein DMF63_01595 [Acidobacteria bacterium]|nr:MAG: hypothetical protein DMF63_01595 [Acidobacteriota bacterium]
MVDQAVQTEGVKVKQVSLRKLKVILACADIVSILFWSYLIAHVFIFDVDAALTSWKIPIVDLGVRYKGLILAGFIAVIFALARNIWSLSIAAYIALYPLIVICWKFPRMLWKAKSPLITLTFLNVVLSFFRSIRYNVASGAALVFFSGVALISDSLYFVIGAVLSLILLLIMIYANRLRIVLRPSVLYVLHSRAITFISNTFQKLYKPANELQPFAWNNVPEAKKSEILVNLQLLMIANRGAFFLSEKLRQFHQSNVRVIFYLFNLLILIFTTVYIFAVANYGIWRVSPDSFQVSDSRFFTFVYYSFASVFGRGINEIVPTADFTRLLVMLQIVFSFFVLAIILTLVFSLQNKRDEEGIETAIQTIRKEGEAVDTFINSEYRMTSDEVLKELERTKAAFVRVIYYLAID